MISTIFGKLFQPLVICNFPLRQSHPCFSLNINIFVVLIFVLLKDDVNNDFLSRFCNDEENSKLIH